MPRQPRQVQTPVEEELPLRRRDIWALVFATYATSLPYLLAFILLFLLAIWFVTEVVFR